MCINDTIYECVVFVVIQGALTHGDRRATESRDLSRFNFDNKVCMNYTQTDKIVLNSF
jgi:hypothetical protein